MAPKIRAFLLLSGRGFLGLACGFAFAGPLAGSVTPGDPIAVERGAFQARWYEGLPDPRIAADPAGGFLTSWTDGGVMHLKAASADDVIQGYAKPLAPRTKSFSPPEAVTASLGGDRYVAVWAGEEGGLRARFVDGTGTPQGDPLEIAQGAFTPTVAAMPDGGFVAGWIVTVDEVRVVRHALARRYSVDGVPAGPLVDLGVADVVGLAGQPGGSVAALLRDFTSEPGTVLTTLQIVGADGVPSTSRAWSRPDDAFLGSALIAADAAGRLFTVHTEAGLDGFPRTIVERYAADGSFLGDTLAEEGLPFELEVPIDLAARPDGSLLVLWDLFPLVTGGPSSVAGLVAAGVTDYGVNYQEFDGGGVAQGPAAPVDGTYYAMGGGVAANDAGWVATYLRPTGPGDPGVFARRFESGCPDGTLCLDGGRFHAEVRWRTSSREGAGRPLQLGGDSGAFWFFSPSNAELVVKVLDGRALNGHFWVFFGSLTDVEFDLTVTDTETGRQATYHNPPGQMASIADTTALPAGGGASVATPRAAKTTAADAECGLSLLCLRDGRFQARAEWSAQGTSGAGTAIPFTGESGMFWFFQPDNVELIVKILDGTAVNGKLWVFYGSLTDVAFDLVVSDTVTGAERRYHNPAGTLASHADVEAFAP